MYIYIIISFGGHLIWQEGAVVLAGASPEQRDRGRRARRVGRGGHVGPADGHDGDLGDDRGVNICRGG